ncbi:hypothetical protein KFE25_008798 [Diacronema lutheri]|uniref:glucose-6-phosphate 1-epimerase n=2 Tax=Diacronema lutheri TaxID=2081491 RepID=A0A7R9UVL9_DIALT|nr:hypothetical protein KFE25_008798 [Diacronema lutheri]|mmetsp:Transcript_6509/g.20475  ORF Transcript_6509/g.20475 Transcript_6509/m.20475 type:complete len:287 (+) Transcript_6509:1-861(+)
MASATSSVIVDSGAVVLRRASGATCEVTLFGAHVRSWKPTGGAEQLFVSSASQPPPKALRGGVPICFPQFADRGPGGKHGFARTSSKWAVLASATEPSPTVTLELRADDETRVSWPGRLLYHVTLSSDTALSLAMQVVNEGEEPAEFTTALHTYFKVDDVTAVRIEGLAGVAYEDCAVPKGADGKPPRTVEEAEHVALVGEVDRVYVGTPAQLMLHDGSTRRIAINAMGFKDTVLWNIGADKATSLADLGAGEWQQYVCIESALIDKPVKLEPHMSWTAGVSYALA